MSDIHDALVARDVIERELRAEIEELRAALEPFARNVQSISLSGALGHITREDLWRAFHALGGRNALG
jgi:hypothetical protein